MLPTEVTQYMPHAGLLLLLLGFIFGIVAMVDSATMTSDNPNQKTALTVPKWYILSQTLLLSGGFMLVAGVVH